MFLKIAIGNEYDNGQFLFYSVRIYLYKNKLLEFLRNDQIEVITFKFYIRVTGLYFFWALGIISYPASVNSLIATDRVFYNQHSRKRNVWCDEFCPVAVKRLHVPNNERAWTTRRRKQCYILNGIAYQFLPSDIYGKDVFNAIFMIGTVKNNDIALLEDYVLSLQG